jgi:hypothetical protein
MITYVHDVRHSQACLSGIYFTQFLRDNTVIIPYKTPRPFLATFFLIGIMGGEIQGPRHCGHQWPIVPAPGDYDDGEISGMIGRGNRSTQRKPTPVPLCPPQTPMLPGREPGPPRWEANE